MSEHDNRDMWTAAAIGAVVGMGAALLVRARQEDETHEIIRRLRPVRRRAEKTVKQARRELGRRAGNASEAGEELLEVGRDLLQDLKTGASEIVKDTRRELQRVARESVADAQKLARDSVDDARTAARRTARRMAR
jgi:gas vesicle protein